MHNKNNNVKYTISPDIIYEFIKDIRDPEMNCTIEDLNIINEDSIEVRKSNNLNKNYDEIMITWKPTSPTCSFAINIGLCIRYKLIKEIEDYMRSMKAYNYEYLYKLDIIIQKGTHIMESDINRQVNDKERYTAALESSDIINYINSLIN